jgi:hypothetical protein
MTFLPTNYSRSQPPQQQEQQNNSHLDSTVNDLVDQFGDTGVEEGEFPQSRDSDYIPTNNTPANGQLQSQPT